ncbi:MAG TPA: hypothetical protein PKV56_18400, partial [Burkholderiaceae bacterium]|nr:hypothetical protein [Burkholderiaceae bacterium]
MKIRLIAIAVSALLAQGASAAVVYQSLSEFEALAGTPGTTIDFGTPILPSCADVGYFKAQGDVSGDCVATSTLINGQRVYVMRGWAWAPTIHVRSGSAEGYGPNGPGSGYDAHTWAGPGAYLAPDPMGGTHLAIEQNRPFMTLGVFTTVGFFGWLAEPQQELLTEGLLILPEGAQITKLEFDYQRQVPEPGTLSLAGLAALLLASA